MHAMGPRHSAADRLSAQGEPMMTAMAVKPYIIVPPSTPTFGSAPGAASQARRHASDMRTAFPPPGPWGQRLATWAANRR
jgi:hypothetical protein